MPINLSNPKPPYFKHIAHAMAYYAPYVELDTYPGMTIADAQQACREQSREHVQYLIKEQEIILLQPEPLTPTQHHEERMAFAEECDDEGGA
tara:strand:+ start:548 stop:823 length:276 start_codon:yes stop_codon:yes gene_type:complete